MTQILKDIGLVFFTFFTLLMLITAIVSIFWAGVPYVPTQRRVIKKIIDLGYFQKDKHLYDLGL